MNPVPLTYVHTPSLTIEVFDTAGILTYWRGLSGSFPGEKAQECDGVEEDVFHGGVARYGLEWRGLAWGGRTWPGVAGLGLEWRDLA